MRMSLLHDTIKLKNVPKQSDPIIAVLVTTFFGMEQYQLPLTYIM